MMKPYEPGNAELKQRVCDLLRNDAREAAERERLVALICLFAELPPPPDPLGMCSQYGALKERFLRCAYGDDGEALEEAFLTLYCHVHGHEAPYTPRERERLDATGGYWCHAGGVSPILKAAPHIQPQTVSVDYGAGNGLQGLLMQKLYPHRLAVQVEISSRMVEAGKHLQAWLGIPRECVEWHVADVVDVSPRQMSFIYLYRPVRPEGEGRRFYEMLARELDKAPPDVVVFSIADCLRDFVSAAFEVFYCDGHLTCFHRGT